MKTNIYIDNDGVINMIAQKHNPALTGWSKSSTGTAEGFQIHWADELIVELNRIDQLENVEFIVLSTWQDAFIEKIVPLVGLNNVNWRVLKDIPAFNVDGKELDWQMSRGTQWWKLLAIKKDIEETKPDHAIWIDDDLIYENFAQGWALRQKGITLIAPDMHNGLTRAHITQIDQIIQNQVDSAVDEELDSDVDNN